MLCIEISCWKDEPIWSAPDEEVFESRSGICRRPASAWTDRRCFDYHVFGIETAYPVYELNFEDHLIPVLEGVHSIENLLTIGRHGLFLNNSMDDNVLLGTKVADTIVDDGLSERRVAEGHARVHEPAVSGQVVAGLRQDSMKQFRQGDGRQQQHDRLGRQRVPRFGEHRHVQQR